jgi:hypothetical protein
VTLLERGFNILELPSSLQTFAATTMPPPSISRERSPIAILLDPKRDIPMGEGDIRLEDYLNDKVQTSADFGSLPNLIANVETQKRQLEEQASTSVDCPSLALG